MMTKPSKAKQATQVKPATKSKRSSWQEKLDQSEGLPKVVPIGPTMKQWGEGTLVVPAPREVDGIMKAVPEGKLITIQEIRAVLAKRHGATIGCPLTTGIFARIAAHAAQEDLEAKRRDVTPYWRTLKSGGFLNEKYPGGLEAPQGKARGRGSFGDRARRAFRGGRLRERDCGSKNRSSLSLWTTPSGRFHPVRPTWSWRARHPTAGCSWSG